MKQPNFLQLTLLSNNSPSTKIHKHIDSRNFLSTFLSHVEECLKENDHEFRLIEPLMDFSFQEDSDSIVLLNRVEVGELSLTYNSNYGESSLIYFSPSGLIESLLFSFNEYPQYTISDYVLMIYEFSSILISQSELYKK